MKHSYKLVTGIAIFIFIGCKYQHVEKNASMGCYVSQNEYNETDDIRSNSHFAGCVMV